MSDSIFHPGDLQSGIALAIQQQKLVACFVRQEDDETSKLWEEQWLVEGGLGDMIKDKAVLLRIEFGSQEAGFLSAFCSISAAPTLVIIRNGQILAQLERNTGEDEFRERLLNAVGLGADAESTLEGQGEILSDSQANIAVSQDPLGGAAVSPSIQANTSTPTSQDQSCNLQSMFPDRAQRLEAERQKRLEAEAAERKERTKRRQKEEQEALATSTSTPTEKGKGKQPASSSNPPDRAKARTDWIRQQKKRNDEAKSERERILAQIENDKLTRRAREQARKESAETPTNTTAASNPTSPQGPFSRPSRPSTRGLGSVCALQIRLFDGSSLKSRFSPTDTLASSVRAHISAQAPPEAGNVAEIPFTFRQILAPQPSRSIEMSDEHRSLLELGLCPSATLVLVPVAGYTEAYAGAGGEGVVSRALGAGTGLVGGVWELASSVFGAVTGYGRGGEGAGATEGSGPYIGGTGDERDDSNAEGAAMAEEESAPKGKVRVKTLADQRAEAAKKGEAEFYNGNSLDFESRDEDKKDKRG
ncbi:hypothetical protein MBLNU230_g6850t1 [Neophaeotheca triangularis]